MQTLEKPNVSYQNFERIHSGPGSHKHIVCDIVVAKLPKTLAVEITTGGLGINRLIHMNLQPIDEHFSVVWNGDGKNPALKFDGAPEKNICVRVEAWGT